MITGPLNRQAPTFAGLVSVEMSVLLYELRHIREEGVRHGTFKEYGHLAPGSAVANEYKGRIISVKQPHRQLQRTQVFRAVYQHDV